MQVTMRRGLETAGQQLREALNCLANVHRCVEGARRRADLAGAGEPAEIQELRQVEGRVQQLRADVLQLLNGWEVSS